jgi:3-hydroxyisobutyrate dehydrogenase
MTTVAFLGLGNMGGPMAGNLLRAAPGLRVYDPVPEARTRAAEAGATPCATAAEAAAGAEVVLSMLPSGPYVKAAYLGEAGVAAGAAPGALFIDCSTIDVDTARAVAAEATTRGFAMVDAPVSGGVAAAQGAGLTFMVGGPAEAFARARPYLEAMGKAVIHAGGPGAGQAAKICNNMLLAISMIGTAEAFTLAQKLGLDPQVFFDISSKASGQCWSMTSYCPVPGPVPTSPANRGYAPGFATAMMLKDLKLAQDAAVRAGAPIPLGAEAAQLYTMFEALGGGGVDFSGIIQMLDGRWGRRD